MCSFAHINQAPIFNEVLGTTVPPQWDKLIQRHFATTPDTSLVGINRTLYASPFANTAVESRSSHHVAVHGEIWKAAQEAGKTPPARTFKVTGYAQMYVVSGAGEIEKNGALINLRPGEKVSFRSGETFSLPYNSALTLFVRNEGATFEVSTSSPKLSALCPPSPEQVAITRSMLGVSPHYAESRLSGSEVTSSRGYARSRAG